MFTNRTILTYLTIAAAVAVASLLSACSEDSSVSSTGELQSETYTYAFNEGQAVGDDGAGYRGEHDRNLMARMIIEEREDGNANVTVELMNTLDGETYPVHAHDMADPSTTPNNTPYNETPNGDVFAAGIEGN